MPFRQDVRAAFHPGHDDRRGGLRARGRDADRRPRAQLAPAADRESPSRKSTANRVELTYLTALIGVAAFLVVASLTANAKESTDPKPAMRCR